MRNRTPKSPDNGKGIKVPLPRFRDYSQFRNDMPGEQASLFRLSNGQKDRAWTCFSVSGAAMPVPAAKHLTRGLFLPFLSLLPAPLPSLKDKAAESQTAQSSGMALLKMGVIAVHGGKSIRGGDFAGGIKRHAFLKPSAKLSLYLGPQPSYHLSGIAHPEIKSQKIHAVFYWKDLGFGVKAELKTRLQKGCQSILKIPEEVPVMMDEHTVIHVAEVMLYLKLFLYQPVKRSPDSTR